MATLPQEFDFGRLTAADAFRAAEAHRRLASLTSAETGPVAARFESHQAPQDAITLELPAEALRILSEILAEMAQGNQVTILPTPAELSIRQSADVLGVSVAYLTEQLDSGAIPSRNVGPERRTTLPDLLAFRQALRQNRLQALEELSALDQELGLGYGP